MPAHRVYLGPHLPPGPPKPRGQSGTLQTSISSARICQEDTVSATANEDVSWSTSDAAIVSIVEESDGSVTMTGEATGTATVTATSDRSGETATISVTTTNRTEDSVSCTGGDLESAILGTSPAIYWRLNDLEGITIEDTSGNDRDGAMHTDLDTEGTTSTSFGVAGLPDGSGRALQFGGGSFVQFPDPNGASGVLDGRTVASDDWRIGVMMFFKPLSLDEDIVLASMSEPNQTDPLFLRAQWVIVIKSNGEMLVQIRKESNDTTLGHSQFKINDGADPFEVGKRYLVGMYVDLNRVSIQSYAVDQAIEDDAGCNIKSAGSTSSDNARFNPPYYFLIGSRFFEEGMADNVVIDEVVVYNQIGSSAFVNNMCTAWNNKDEAETCTITPAACEEETSFS